MLVYNCGVNVGKQTLHAAFSIAMLVITRGINPIKQPQKTTIEPPFSHGFPMVFQLYLTLPETKPAPAASKHPNDPARTVHIRTSADPSAASQLAAAACDVRSGGKRPATEIDLAPWWGRGAVTQVDETHPGWKYQLLIVYGFLYVVEYG